MDRMRTMLFCPASQPKMFLNAPVFHPDAILFDLEDAVAYAEKDSARDLLCEAMAQLDFGTCRVFVRINSLHTPFGEEDVRAVVPAGIRYLRLAMCETAADVQELDGLLDAVEAECQIPSHSVKVQCSIETARGVLNAREIVAASSRVISLSFGAEDYTRSMGTSRSKSAQELQFARTWRGLRRRSAMPGRWASAASRASTPARSPLSTGFTPRMRKRSPTPGR